MRHILIPFLIAPLCACATTESVKRLAQSTGPLIVETEGTASAVQKKFVEQNAVVARRIAEWDGIAASSRSLVATPIALWYVDSQAGGANAASAKGKLLMLERIRTPEPTISQTPTAIPQEPAPVSVNSAKLLLLLDGIAKGKLMTVETAGAWVQATDKALSDLKKDAEPTKEK